VADLIIRPLVVFGFQNEGDVFLLPLLEGLFVLLNDVQLRLGRICNNRRVVQHLLGVWRLDSTVSSSQV